MPKRWYKIELQLVDDKGNVLESDTQDERYEDDTEARQKFDEKDRAARNAGRGSSEDDE
jgi:hypothetical protein